MAASRAARCLHWKCAPKNADAGQAEQGLLCWLSHDCQRWSAEVESLLTCKNTSTLYVETKRKICHFHAFCMLFEDPSSTTCVSCKQLHRPRCDVLAAGGLAVGGA